MSKPVYHWPNNARLALSVVVNVEELSEYNVGQGTRSPSRWTSCM